MFKTYFVAFASVVTGLMLTEELVLFEGGGRETDRQTNLRGALRSKRCVDCQGE